MIREYSKRERREQFYRLKEKETRRLLERCGVVAKAAHSWGKDNMVELDEPIRKGWVRYFEVRKDVERSKEGPRLKRLLQIVQNPVICEDKNFMHKAQGWTKKNRRMEPVHQELKRLSESEFEKVPEDLKKYFRKTIERIPFWGKVFEHTWFVVHLPDWKFTFKIEPHFVTHAQILHSDAVSEYTMLRNKLWHTEMLAMKYTDHPSDPDVPSYKRAGFKNETKKILGEELEDCRY